MKLVPIVFALVLTASHAQNTLQLPEGQTSPPASLQEMLWLEGHWQGEAFGGVAEEIWSSPKGGSMMFVFRLIHDDKISFYEIGHIKEQANTLLMQLKHFDGDLKGWETKDQTVDFRLIKMEADAVYFEGLTIQKISDGRIKIHVLIEEGKEAVFDYQRQ